MSLLLMTVAMCSNHSIPYTMWTSQYLYLQNLQSKHQCLHGCRGCRIRTSERISSPSQYKTYRDLNDIKLSFRKEPTFLYSLASTITTTNFINFCLKNPHSWYRKHRLIDFSFKAYYVAMNIYRSSSHPTLKASTYWFICNILLLICGSVIHARE
jgi:hypothetical protein